MYTNNRHNSNQTNSQNISYDLPLDFKSLVTTVSGAFIIGGFTTGLAVYIYTRTSAFTIDSHTQAIEKLEAQKIDAEVYQANQGRIEDKITNIQDDVIEIKAILKGQ